MDLSTAIQSVIISNLYNLDICFPGSIEKWDKENLTADVLPSFDSSFFDGTVIEAQKLLDLPICYPMSSDGAIVFPLKKGDPCMLVVSQRNLDNWKAGGERVPGDSSLFPIGSAVVLPGVAHTSVTKNYSQIRNAMGIYGKKIFIGDSNASPDVASTLGHRDLIEAFRVLCEQLLVATYPTAMGPTGPMAAPAKTIIEKLAAEIGKLES